MILTCTLRLAPALLLAAAVSLATLSLSPAGAGPAAPPLLAPDWSFDLVLPAGIIDHGLTGSLADDGSAVLAGGFGPKLGRLVRLSATGRELWRKQSPGSSFDVAQMSADSRRIAVSASINETPNTCDSDALFTMLDSRGRTLWKRVVPTDGRMSDPPLLTVTTATLRGCSGVSRLYVMRGSNGALLWNPRLEMGGPGEPESVVPSSRGDRILIMGRDSINMHTSSGRRLWTRRREGVELMDTSAGGELTVIIRRTRPQQEEESPLLMESFDAKGALLGLRLLQTRDANHISLNVAGSGRGFIVVTGLPSDYGGKDVGPITGYSPACREIWRREEPLAYAWGLWPLGPNHFAFSEASAEETEDEEEAVQKTVQEPETYHLIDITTGRLSRSARLPVSESDVILGGNPARALYALAIGPLLKGRHRVERFTLPAR